MDETPKRETKTMSFSFASCLPIDKKKSIIVDSKFYKTNNTIYFFDNNTYKTEVIPSLRRDNYTILTVKPPYKNGYILIQIVFSDGKTDAVVLKYGDGKKRIIYSAFNSKEGLSLSWESITKNIKGQLTELKYGFYFASYNEIEDNEIIKINQSFGINTDCNLCYKELNQLTKCQNELTKIKKELFDYNNKPNNIVEQTINITPGINPVSDSTALSTSEISKIKQINSAKHITTNTKVSIKNNSSTQNIKTK